MRDHDRTGIKVELSLTSDLALDPWRADGNQGLVLQSVGKIHDRTACLFGQLEIGAGELGLRGEKGEIHVFQLVWSHRLHEGNLILDLLELAKGLVVVKQTNVRSREISLFQHFLELFALERSRAHNGYPKYILALCLHLDS